MKFVNIVNYNVSFDVNFLYDDYIKHLQRPLTNNFVDILRLSRRLCYDLPSCDLDSMLDHFNLKTDKNLEDWQVKLYNCTTVTL